MSSHSNAWAVPGSVDPGSGSQCAAEHLQAMDRLTQSLYADRTIDHLCMIGSSTDTTTPVVAEVTISPYTEYISIGVLVDVASPGHVVDIAVSGDAITQRMSAVGSGWLWLGPLRTAAPSNDDWCAADVSSDSDTESITIEAQQDHADVDIRAILVREVRQVSTL